MSLKVMALDIGGTKTELAIVECISDLDDQDTKLLHYYDGKTKWSLKTLLRKRIPTQRDNGYESYLKKISEFIIATLNEARISPSEISAMGAGIPGSVLPSTGKMINGNSLIFKDKNILSDIKMTLKLECPIKVANDANLFAYAEALLGTGVSHAKNVNKTVQDLSSIGIILGTGVGGGTILQGNILTGSNGGASEIGHTNYQINGRECYCSSNGCYEQYLSGPAIQHTYFEKSQKQLSSKEIFLLANKQDPIAQEVINEYQNILAQFLSQLYNLYDPDFIVLGGGVSNQEIIYEGLANNVSIQCFLPNLERYIYKNSLGDSAGVYGAALIALQSTLS